VRQIASFEPFTIKIGSGVQAVDDKIEHCMNDEDTIQAYTCIVLSSHVCREVPDAAIICGATFRVFA